MTFRTARAAATTTVVLSTTAVPVILAATGTWTPQLPSPATARQWIAQPMSTGFVIVLAEAAAVALWLLLATVILTHAYAALACRLRLTTTLRLPGPLQGLTAALLGATAVTTATGATAHANPATATTSGGLPTAEPTTTTSTSHHHASPDPRPAEQTPTYTVRRGDSLCRIAARTLGDADRWPEIFALNRGTHFPHVGGTLRDPDVIYPGWTLDLPADADPPPTARPPANTAPPKGGNPDERAAPDSDPRPSRPAPAHTEHPAAPQSAATTNPHGNAAQPSSTGNAISPRADTSRPAEKTSPGVSLPTGSWVDLGLASAIVAAAALVWAHRRRRYVPRAPSTRPRLDDPTLIPMPPVVAQIRRGLRRATARYSHLGDPAHRRADNPYPHRHTASERRDRTSDRDDAHPAVDQAEDEGPRSVVPTLHALLSPPRRSAGLGLTGPGAHAAARGLLTAALAAGGAEHPDARTEVVMPSATAATLLGTTTANLPRTPRLTVTTDLDEALRNLEAQTMHRTRLLQQHDVGTIDELRAANPYEEPVPPVMLLADPSGEQARIAALLNQGQRLNIHGVLLGHWTAGDTITVDNDGTTASGDRDARHTTHPDENDRLTVLNPAETLDLLTTLAESHTGLPQVPVPAERLSVVSADAAYPPTAETPASPATHTEGAIADSTADGETRADKPRSTASGPGDGHQDNPAVQASKPPEDSQAPDQATSDRGSDPEDGKQVRVQVLGAPTVVGADPNRTPRAKSLELLVYLAVHDGAASSEAILDDLLPDAPTSKAAGRLYTYVSGLRAVLRHAGRSAGHVTHPDHRYVLNRDLLDIDLWRMRTATRDAAQATDPHTRAAALRRAVDAYTGPLADGCDYEWIEPYREAIRQEALDAHLALTDTLTGQPAQQLNVLDAAITHNPHHETLYQAAMRARADLGDVEGIRMLRRTLARRLNDIDAEPSDDTLALADRLIADLRRHSNASSHRRPLNTEGGTE
ncbi:LysM peptidoglycan-binding domain-containing protein [Micromonospora sp. A3M-1-15]|uniref:BTAD domain-containing putative transcriptional regulator n=1 Tax=Micromonospora sp. A3M-1-15 TaxID=2962035 RepID=UPI0020B792CB|nr:BTAD domain-containing putative transcriptional regulator [Micromonospora sp. A3M-1-15]MCP3785266.1 LysM peptidoglycan-binding domain-containing protein [Micromonospora sp. A3M-1-15]